MGPKMPSYSQMPTQNIDPYPVTEDGPTRVSGLTPPPWAHIDTKTVDPVVPPPGTPKEKKHPVYTWLEEHAERLDGLDEMKVMGIVFAICTIILLALNSAAIVGMLLSLAWMQVKV